MAIVTITKSPSVCVKPSEPITEGGGYINLSSTYDKPSIGQPVTVLIVFDKPIDDPAETIKRGLSQALVHYYPMSGRLAVRATGDDVVVECSGKGVSFVTASADSALKDVQELHDPSLKEELAIFYPARVPGCHDDPLLLMQVTVFSCGGFIIGLTWDHSIADGTGIGQFMQAVGELARGLPSPSVVPVRSDESLIGKPPSVQRIFPLLHNLQPSLLVLLDISVPSSVINRIKNDFSINRSQTCSVFEAVTAMVWQCRTRAIIEDPEAPTMLMFGANARKYAGAKDGYYGNCVTGLVVTTTCGTVANGNIQDLIRMIQRAKDEIPNQYSNVVEDNGNIQELDVTGVLGYNIFGVTSWRNLGVEKADFGGGRPSRVIAYGKIRMGLPFCVSCLPVRNDEFFSVMSLCVKEEHVGAFLREIAHFT